MHEAGGDADAWHMMLMHDACDTRCIRYSTHPYPHHTITRHHDTDAYDTWCMWRIRYIMHHMHHDALHTPIHTIKSWDTMMLMHDTSWCTKHMMHANASWCCCILHHDADAYNAYDPWCIWYMIHRMHMTHAMYDALEAGGRRGCWCMTHDVDAWCMWYMMHTMLYTPLSTP